MKKLSAFLNTRSAQEREGLQKILGASDNSTESLAHALVWESSNIITYFSDPTYYQIVQKVARKMGIPADEGDSVEFLESAISKNIFKEMWDRMTPEQRDQFAEKLQSEIGSDIIGGVASGGALFAALTAAHLSGFGIYVLSSTALGALTSGLGLTLPFVAYMGVSRAIAVVLGPVGWIGAGLLTIFQLTGPNWKKVTMAVVYISMLRNAPSETPMADSGLQCIRGHGPLREWSGKPRCWTCGYPDK